MAADYTVFSDEVLTTLLQNARKELLTLENTPKADQQEDYQIKFAFTKEYVEKLTEALKAKANESLESHLAEVDCHKAPPSYSVAKNDDIITSVSYTGYWEEEAAEPAAQETYGCKCCYYLERTVRCLGEFNTFEYSINLVSVQPVFACQFKF